MFLGRERKIENQTARIATKENSLIVHFKESLNVHLAPCLAGLEPVAMQV